MIQFITQGASLLLVAQWRVIVGDEVLISLYFVSLLSGEKEDYDITVLSNQYIL